MTHEAISLIYRAGGLHMRCLRHLAIGQNKNCPPLSLIQRGTYKSFPLTYLILALSENFRPPISRLNTKHLQRTQFKIISSILLNDITANSQISTNV